MRFALGLRRFVGRTFTVLLLVTIAAWFRSYRHEDLFSLKLGANWHMVQWKNAGKRDIEDRYFVVCSTEGKIHFVMNTDRWANLGNCFNTRWGYPNGRQRSDEHPRLDPYNKPSLCPRVEHHWLGVHVIHATEADFFWESQWPWPILPSHNVSFVSFAPPYWALIVPHAYFSIIFAIPTILAVHWSLKKIRQAFRGRRGLCAQCGYDLRASPERCPECGRLRDEKCRTAIINA